MRSQVLLSVWFAALVMTLVLAGNAQGQGGGRGAAPAPPTARASAPIDLTGYWVAYVTGGLALANGDASQRRLCQYPAQRRWQAPCRRVGSCEG